MRISDWSSDVCSSDLVVNIEQTTQAIKRAVENAEHMANCRAQSVYVGISGTHIRSLNSTGVAPVRAGSVSDRDVDSVMDAARAIAIPADQTILHVIPQEFDVEGREDRKSNRLNSSH